MSNSFPSFPIQTLMCPSTQYPKWSCSHSSVFTLSFIQVLHLKPSFACICTAFRFPSNCAARTLI